MSYEYKAGQFSLFANTKKDKDCQPDMTGAGADLTGAIIRIAAWKKKDKSGNTWLSCKIDVPKDDAKPARPQLSEEMPF